MSIDANASAGIGLALSAAVFGLRHGFDVDHVAALSDISAGEQATRRRLVLSSLYIAGHAAVVVVLGAIAVTTGRSIPPKLDRVMQAVVGLTLVVLALSVFVSLVRDRGNFRLRSRWTVLHDGARTVAGFITRRGTSVGVRATDIVELVHVHEHRHPHGGGDHDHDHSYDRDDHGEAGDHSHHHRPAESQAGSRSLLSSPTGTTAVRSQHVHKHRHAAVMPADPFPSMGRTSALAVGAIHGIGAETPTQLAVLASAASVAETRAGILVLAGFVAGMIVSNSIIAVIDAAGFGVIGKHRWVYLTVSVVAATSSLVVGASLLGNW